MRFGETVEELQERMSSAEFTRWAAFYAAEPFGFEWERWQAGMIASSIINAVYATIPVPKGKRGPKRLQPQDLYPASSRSKQPALTPAQAAYLKRKHGKRRNGNS